MLAARVITKSCDGKFVISNLFSPVYTHYKGLFKQTAFEKINITDTPLKEQTYHANLNTKNTTSFLFLERRQRSVLTALFVLIYLYF